MICALLPGPAISPATPAARLAGPASAADQHVARPAGAAFDVVKVWTEERAQLFAAINPGIGGASVNAWASIGGVSILPATRFTSAAHVATGSATLPSTENRRSAEAATAVPLPPPSPLARLNGIKRNTVDRKAPAQQAPQLASLPPQAPEHGYFDFFRRLFGNPDYAARAILAANPKTAIYDIEKRVVYLPNGDKLEAHSGYGQWLDDPTSVKRKDRGVTPPNVYAVSFREKPFHGVRALRLTPVGDGNMYGRDGMLAHSYMLGEDGQSNGCVSVKDYQKFLQAYEDGAFKQLIVVRSVDDVAPSRIASAAPGNV